MNLVLLSDVCEINPRMDSGISDDSECSFVPMEYVDDISGTIANTSIRRVGDVKKGYTFFKNDDVIFAKITPCMENGKCAIGKNLKNGIAFGSTEYHVVRAKEEIIPEWIYHFLRQERIRQQATGWFRGTAGQQRVPATFLEELKIPLPPLTEQKRIASLLRRADRLRHLRRTAHDLGDNVLQSVFLEMFGDPIKNNPNGYEICELKDVCTRITDGTHQPPEWAESGIPFLFVSNVVDGELTFDTQKFISEKTWYELQKRCPIELNDILYTIVGSYGNAALVKTTRKFSFQRHIAHVKPNPKKILPVFLLGMMQSINFREQVEQQVRGVAQKTLNLGELQEIKIFVPPLNLQEEFASVVRRVESLRGRIAESMRQVEGLFESLLAEAFS